MQTISREQLIEKLNKKYPNVWTKLSEQFNPNYKDAIWTGENSFIDKGKLIPAFDMDGNYNKYELGVRKELNNFVEKFGYYFEAYDNGTFFIWKV